MPFLVRRGISSTWPPKVSSFSTVMWSQSWRKSALWAPMWAVVGRGCGLLSTTVCWSATLRLFFERTPSFRPTISTARCSWTQRSGKSSSATSRVWLHSLSTSPTNLLSWMNGPPRRWLLLDSAPCFRQKLMIYFFTVETCPLQIPQAKNCGTRSLSLPTHRTPQTCRKDAQRWQREYPVCCKGVGLDSTHQI